VTDRDTGLNGQIQGLEITGGDQERYFSLERSKDGEYTIHVARTLDRESFPDGFNLTVEATDRGSPPRNTSKVLIVVTGL